MRICGIYKITSPIGRIYIGKSVDISSRFNVYKNIKCKSQPRLFNSLKKYSPTNHTFEILIECSEDKLNELEKYYIKLYGTFNSENGLNLKEVGEGGMFTEETKRKISLANKGVKLTLEHRKKLSEAKKGKPTWNKGLKSSKESVLKMINSKKGKPNLKLRGVKFSEERCKKLSLARINSPFQNNRKIICTTNNKVYESIKSASIDLNIYHSNILRVCKGRQDNAKGFKFNYL